MLFGVGRLRAIGGSGRCLPRPSVVPSSRPVRSVPSGGPLACAHSSSGFAAQCPSAQSHHRAASFLPLLHSLLGLVVFLTKMPRGLSRVCWECRANHSALEPGPSSSLKWALSFAGPAGHRPLVLMEVAFRSRVLLRREAPGRCWSPSGTGAFLSAVEDARLTTRVSKHWQSGPSLHLLLRGGCLLAPRGHPRAAAGTRGACIQQMQGPESLAAVFHFIS